MIQDSFKPIIGLLLGDACGVGPELIARLCKEDKVNEHCNPIIIGDKRIFERAREIVGGAFEIKVIENVQEAKFETNVYYILDQKDVDPNIIQVGEISEVAGKASGDMLIRALELCKEKKLDGFAFAPLNKAAMKLGGHHFESENKMFGHYFGCEEKTCEVNVLEDLWTSRVTSHVPVKDIVKNLSIESILEGIKIADNTLKFSGKAKPVIGVAALNPHGGENGTCGREEIDMIMPAIEKAKEQGICAVGPYPADILFIKAFNKEFDAAVTMYHDQGQIALKLKGFQYGVTFHANLPTAIATAAHGSAFDIAGKGIATADAMENAVKLTSRVAKSLKDK
ncbi:MAG: 4-hydroxythreonine-4-phosphate dehydrogenase [Clostridia bacterium]|jgi:4-hydroxythreonine-4-phosphate dehydrogenase|nr:4-hydroxythreonine-4-phosphate dehydrogenase [Clostridia bacterium]